MFDVYDRWSGRSAGRNDPSCRRIRAGGPTRHFPVNSNEAEARRRARFFPIGHTPGPMTEPRRIEGKEHPRTLDLRRV